MNFNFKVSNLGNIEDTNIEIKPFTVIAGENSSGKSFITKSLYSILDALNNDYIKLEISLKIHNIKRDLDKLHDSFSTIATADKEFLELFYTGHIMMFDNFLDIQEEFDRTFLSDLKSIKKDAESYLEKRGKLKKFQNKIKYLKSIIDSIDKIIKIVENPRNTIVYGIEKNLDDNIKKNYQITSFEPLKNSNIKIKDTILDMDTIGSVTIDKNFTLDFSFKLNGVEEIQKIANTIYLDSPVYLKIRKGLEKNDFTHPFYQKDRYLKDYPLYIEKLYQFIDRKYIDEADFKSLSDEISTLIDGNLIVTKSGDIEYVLNNGTTIPLSLTAMGISNIGLIELLLKNNIINKGSFLIIDEPEAHLHPKWQVELINILYKIAKAGANVIIATHSIDMIKAVEVLLNKDEESKGLIALNQMPYEQTFKDLDNGEKIEEILTDLSSPFYDLYMENL